MKNTRFQGKKTRFQTPIATPDTNPQDAGLHWPLQDWIVTERRENNPGRALIGFRVTNCEMLMKNALSLQVFDRQTVTVEMKPDGTQKVSLTEQDGRQMMTWLHANAERFNFPIKEIWDKLPKDAPPDERSKMLMKQLATLPPPTVTAPNPPKRTRNPRTPRAKR